MKPNKKNKIARTTTFRKEYNVEAKGLRDWYWADGIMFYPMHRRGCKNPHKRLQSYQIRRYKTWKCSRKRQWKN